MALQRVEFKDGVVVGKWADIFTQNDRGQLKAVVNGWDVTVKPASRRHKEGRIICRFESNCEGEKDKLYREFPLEDGILGLASGSTKNRHVFFHTTRYQEFLNRFGIKSVKFEEPNREYEGLDYQSGREYERIRLRTDGTVTKEIRDPQTNELRSEDYRKTRKEKTTYHDKVTFKVAGASWVLCREKGYRNGSYKDTTILYTKVKDVFSLEDSLAALSK